MKRLKYIALIILSSCNYTNDNMTNLKQNELIENHIIQNEGVYFSKKHNVSIDIKIKNLIVAYSVKDSSGLTLFNSNKPTISNVHRWGILLDSTGVFWIQSSDIGLYILQKDTQNIYKHKSFGILNDSNIKLVPDEIYNAFSSTIKKKFKK